MIGGTVDDDGIPRLYVDGEASGDERAAAALLGGSLVLPGELAGGKEPGTG